MTQKQRSDPRLTVERDRFGLKAAILLAVLALLVAWEARHVLVDALEPPYPAERADGTASTLPGPNIVRVSPVPTPRNGTLAGLFTADDYPSQAIRRDEQGTVNAALEIDSKGRVAQCTVAGSSGSRSLDRATCRILTQRARFDPATDPQGRPARGSLSQKITWRLEG